MLNIVLNDYTDDFIFQVSEVTGRHYYTSTGSSCKAGHCVEWLYWRLHLPTITLSCRQRCGLQGHVWFWATRLQPPCGDRPQNQSSREVKVFLERFQTFICFQYTSLLPKSWEGLHLFSRLRQREWFPPKLIRVRVLFIPVYCYQVLNSVGLNMKRFVFKSHHRHFQKQIYLFKRGKRLMFDGGENPVEPGTLVAFPRSCERRPW